MYDKYHVKSKKRASEWDLWAVVFQRAEVSPLSRYHDLRDSKMRRRTGGVAVLSLSLRDLALSRHVTLPLSLLALSPDYASGGMSFFIDFRLPN